MSFCEFLLHPLLGNKCKNNCSLSQLIHCVSKNAPTLASCSFNKQGLILIFFGKQYQHLSIVMCLFDFYCSFTFTYFICFLISATEMTRCWRHSVFVYKQWCSARTVLIKSLYELKAYTACQFVMEFPDKGWRKCSNKGLLRKLRNDAALTCSSSSVTWVKCRRYWRRCWWMRTQNFTCVWEDETPSLWTSAKLNSSIHSHLHFSLPTKHVTPRDITVLILKNKYIKHQYLSMGLTSICASEKKKIGWEQLFQPTSMHLNMNTS